MSLLFSSGTWIAYLLSPIDKYSWVTYSLPKYYEIKLEHAFFGSVAETWVGDEDEGLHPQARLLPNMDLHDHSKAKITWKLVKSEYHSWELVYSLWTPFIFFTFWTALDSPKLWCSFAKTLCGPCKDRANDRELQIIWQPPPTPGQH